MLIKNGITFIWSGTAATIPTGWSRVSGLDDYFAKCVADGVNPNSTGGNATHSHSATGTHSHSINSHTHTITLPYAQNYRTGQDTASSGQPYGDPGYHYHANFNSGGATSRTVSTVSATYASTSNNPPYHTVIFITPDEDTNYLPAGVITLGDTDLTHSFYVCDGNNDTPDLTDKFLLGASAGSDAGDTGGSSTNVHTLTHTHTSSHSHSSATSGGLIGSNSGRVESGSAEVYWTGHTHTITLTAKSVNLTSVDLTTSETVEPEHVKLAAFMSDAIRRAAPGMIGMWLNTLATIPTGWALCDGENGTLDLLEKYVKITTTVSAIGDTGGSHTHSHASQTHSHSASHTHGNSPDPVYHSNNVEERGSGGGNLTNSSTYHNTASSDATLTTTTSSTAADEQNNEPEYREVAFIKLVSVPAPGLMFYKIMR